MKTRHACNEVIVQHPNFWVHVCTQHGRGGGFWC